MGSGVSVITSKSIVPGLNAFVSVERYMQEFNENAIQLLKV